MIVAPVLLGLLGAIAAPVDGQPPRALDLPGLGAPSFTTFTGRDGVPEATISSIAVDADGFGWLASPLGLARYDGHHWEAPTRGVQGQIADLHVDADRKLWVSLTDRGLARRDGDDWRLFDQTTGLPTQQVRRHGGDARPGREELWIGAFGVGLWRLTEAGLTSWTVKSGDLRSDRVYRLAATERPDGRRVVWAATRAGLVRIDEESAQIFERRPGLPSDVMRDPKVWRSPSGA